MSQLPTTASLPTRRPRHASAIRHRRSSSGPDLSGAEHGRGRLRRPESATRYGRRNQAETARASYKHLVGPRLRARSLPAQQGEVAIAVAVLNTTIRIAKPVPVRVAWAARTADQLSLMPVPASTSCRIRRANDGVVRWIEARGRPDGGRGTIHQPS